MNEISRVAFTVFGRPIYWYGVVIALGVLLGVLVACRREKRAGLPEDAVLNAALVVMPAAIVCARIYYVIFSWDQYAGDLMQVFNIRQGGLAIYGGILGGVLAGFLYARARRLSFWRLADALAPSIALGQAFGRWGNFFNQEAYGAAVTDPRWQFFPAAVWIEAVESWHWATFFYESVWCLGAFAVLIALDRKGKFRKPGDVFLWYVLLYAVERAVVEGLRTDSLFVGTARVSQLLALFSAVACAAYWLVLLVRAGRMKPGHWVLSALTAAPVVACVPFLLGGDAPIALTLTACALLLADGAVLYRSLYGE